ncbi:MAG: CoA transferase [Dehalococcoidales bacterium]|jgi:crotonobetainyl-CoA:carnitine CoA-transferase CaiB-like acyl-CoA transferase
MNKLPLEGIRVLDFCQMWAGPHATEWLSVMGAEVIKVETSVRIDYMRTVGAPPGLAGTGPNVGSAFASLNWGKKSIALNMTTPKARELAKKLIRICDVVTENFGGGVLERWGLSYTEMKAIKPDIIYYAGSGYGRSGPHKERPAYAEIVDAFTGATFTNGYPGGEPNVIGVSPWTDGAQAIHGAVSILTALYHHRRTGEGQQIDAAMIEGNANFLGEMVMGYLINGNTGERTGNRDAAMAPHGCYPCKTTGDEEEWLALAVANQKEWESLCALMGNPEWTNNPEFSDELSRWDNQEALDAHLGGWTRRYGAYELAEMLQRAGIAATPSLSTKQLTHDKHLEARGFFKKPHHPVLGDKVLAGLPVRFSDYAEGNYGTPPLLGQHNGYVFGELLGLSAEEIQKLTEEKVLE